MPRTVNLFPAVICLLALCVITACDPTPGQPTPTATAPPPTETMASPTPSPSVVVSPTATRTRTTAPLPSPSATATRGTPATPTQEIGIEDDATPTPRPTNTPRPTVTATAPQTVLFRVRVNLLNIRSEPNGGIIDAATFGQILTVRAAFRDVGSCRWWKIDFGPGWVAEYCTGSAPFMEEVEQE